MNRKRLLKLSPRPNIADGVTVVSSCVGRRRRCRNKRLTSSPANTLARSRNVSAFTQHEEMIEVSIAMALVSGSSALWWSWCSWRADASLVAVVVANCVAVERNIHAATQAKRCGDRDDCAPRLLACIARSLSSLEVAVAVAAIS